jgi:hypothetical protein
MGCWISRPERQFHPCILVGTIIRGQPIAEYNRRVISFRADIGYVQEGSFAAVRAGKGTVSEVELMGRVKVASEEQLSVVQNWVEKVWKEAGGNVSEEIIFEGVKEEIAAREAPAVEEDFVELEIYRACIVNRMRNRVFVYKRPSSFP